MAFHTFIYDKHIIYAAFGTLCVIVRALLAIGFGAGRAQSSAENFPIPPLTCVTFERLEWTGYAVRIMAFQTLWTLKSVPCQQIFIFDLVLAAYTTGVGICTLKTILDTAL